MLFTGCEVLIEKNCAKVLGIWTLAVLKTKGTVFPNTDPPRAVNNIIFCFFLKKTRHRPCNKSEWVHGQDQNIPPTARAILHFLHVMNISLFSLTMNISE